jgi:hypothetical protein
MDNSEEIKKILKIETALCDQLYKAFSRNEVDEAYIQKPGQKCAPLQDFDVVRDIFRCKQEALAAYREARGIK